MRLFQKRGQSQQPTVTADDSTTNIPMAERSTNAPANNNSSSHRESFIAGASSSSVAVVSGTNGNKSSTVAGEELPLLRSKNAVLQAKKGFVIAFEKVSFEERYSLFRSPRSLLQDVSGYLLPGSITTVLSANPLSSRKLLEVIAGVEERASGSVMANGLPAVSTAFRRRVAFITSTGVCVRDATVRSNLLFSVRMRVETLDEDRIVKKVSEAVSLQHCLDVKTEVLTPSQLYQLTLGMELVRNPMLLALDMPMCGISSGEIDEFASMLRSLAGNSGRVVVLSGMDLPRGAFNIADNILLLGPQGQLLYSGPKENLKEFLQEQTCIPRVGDETIGELLVTLEESTKSSSVASAFTNSATYAQIQQQVEEHRKCIASNSFDPVSRSVAPSPNYFLKWFLLTTYTCRRATIGQQSFLLVSFILFFLFFLTASLLAGSGSDQDAMQNKRGIIFFLLSCSMQVNIILIDAEVKEFFSAVHLRNNNYFDNFQYFTATVLRLILPRVIFSILCAGCSIFILTSYFALALTMWLMSLAHASLILLLVYWHPVEQDLWLIHNMYHAYCIILSGFLICLPTVPKIFTALSLLRYGYGGMVASELRGNQYSCDTNTGSSYRYTGDQYLAMEGLTHDNWGKSSLILFIIFTVLLALVALSMHIVWIPHSG